jgi:pseudouridine-5'-phosphate glycosidase
MKFSPEVEKALKKNQPIVALESTIISHGLPRPINLEVAREVENIVRANGATPATIALLDGTAHIGLTDEQLEAIANRDDVIKASTRDLAIAQAKKLSAATTVAATSHLAANAGIKVFATGGLGGVHRGANESFDESADLTALAQLDMTVVCAGVKSILDVAATLERLETYAIGVVGFKTKHFPGFYLTESGFDLEYQVDTPEEVASIMKSRYEMGTQHNSLIVANPVVNQMDKVLHDRLLENGLKAAAANNIHGKETTPFLLEYFHTESKGESLRVNIEIIKSNSALAAQIAAAW